MSSSTIPEQGTNPVTSPTPLTASAGSTSSATQIARAVAPAKTSGMSTTDPTITPSASTDATATSTTAAAETDDGFTFEDLLDIINPLQHIPVVSSIYRELTGDKIGDFARVAGATLYGGPIGLAVAGADYVLKEATGEHADEHVVAMLNGSDDTNGQDAGKPIELAFFDDNSESSFNALSQVYSTSGTATATTSTASSSSSTTVASVINPASPEQERLNHQAAQMAILAQKSNPDAAGGPISPGALGTLSQTQKQLQALARSQAQKQNPATPPEDQHASASVSHPAGDGHAFPLDRARQMQRTNSTSQQPLIPEYANINKSHSLRPKVSVVSPTAGDAATPGVAAATAQANPVQVAPTEANPTQAKVAEAAAALSHKPQGSEAAHHRRPRYSSATHGKHAEPAAAATSADSEISETSAPPSSNAMAMALRAQGLQPVHEVFDSANAMSAATSMPPSTPVQGASPSASAASLPLSLMPSSADSAPMATTSSASRTAPSSASATNATAATMTSAQAQGQSVAQSQPQGPVEVPPWFDKAMQKALSNYERTGSLTGTPAVAAPASKTTATDTSS